MPLRPLPAQLRRSSHSCHSPDPSLCWAGYRWGRVSSYRWRSTSTSRCRLCSNTRLCRTPCPSDRPHNDSGTRRHRVLRSRCICPGSDRWGFHQSGYRRYSIRSPGNSPRSISIPSGNPSRCSSRRTRTLRLTRSRPDRHNSRAARLSDSQTPRNRIPRRRHQAPHMARTLLWSAQRSSKSWST